MALISSIVQRKEEIFEMKAKQLEEAKNSTDRQAVSTISKEDKLANNFGHILMELRKAANHPLLRRCLYDNCKLAKMATLITAVRKPTLLKFELTLGKITLRLLPKGTS
jgi:hypothetical protein